jgi:hypothetical protein
VGNRFKNKKKGAKWEQEDTSHMTGKRLERSDGGRDLTLTGLKIKKRSQKGGYSIFAI